MASYRELMFSPLANQYTQAPLPNDLDLASAFMDSLDWLDCRIDGRVFRCT